MIWRAILPALVFQSVGAYLYFVVFTDPDSVPILFTVIKICIFAWPLAWYVFGFRPALRVGQNKNGVVLGVITGLLSLSIILCAFFLFQSELSSGKEAIQDKIRSFGIENYYLLFAAFLSIFHAALEEYYWRWFVFGGLTQRLNIFWAAIISSVAFSAHHYIVLSQFFSVSFSILGTLAVCVAGLLWCALYYHTGKLYASWISHMLADAGIMITGYLLLF